MTLDQYDVHSLGHGHGREQPLVISDTKEIPKAQLLIPDHYKEFLHSILIPRGLIRDRIEKMAMEVVSSCCSEGPLQIICILKGSRGFFETLISILNRIFRYRDHHTEPPFVEYYVRLKKDPHDPNRVQTLSDDLSPLQGNNVLIVEDLIASGLTLSRFCRQLLDQKPRSIRVACLLEKRTKKRAFKADFVGFSIPDKFVVGYGLDHEEKYRDLEHLAVLKTL